GTPSCCVRSRPGPSACSFPPTWRTPRRGMATPSESRSERRCGPPSCRSFGGSLKRDGLDSASETTSGSIARRVRSEHRDFESFIAPGSSRATVFSTPSLRRLWQPQSRDRRANLKHGHWRIDIFISPLWQGRREESDTTARGRRKGRRRQGSLLPLSG